jgi:hypothetical protein
MNDACIENSVEIAVALKVFFFRYKCRSDVDFDLQ